MNDRCEIRTHLLIGRIPALRQVIFTAVAVCAAWILLFVIDPVKQPLLPACLFHSFTGFYCPGCGSTRALHELAHGNFAAALRLNAPVVLGLPLGLGIVVFRRRRDLPSWWLRLLLVCLALFGIARNIPLFPFTILAP